MTPIDLWDLLPSAYRIDDAARGYPLRTLLNIVSQQANLVRDNIGDLWDDFFIETCAEWVIPYIGDLVGNIPIAPVLRGQRGDVARTIYFRRRKGTLPMLEELARYVTGWSVHAVAFFDIMTWTQNMNHLRPNVGTVRIQYIDARDPLVDPSRSAYEIDKLDRTQTAFDTFSHSADVRPLTSSEGWHNIPKVGFFIWRLGSYVLEDVVPRQSGAQPYGYHFSPLGSPAPLFNQAEREIDETGVASEIHVSSPIRPTAFYYSLQPRLDDLPEVAYYPNSLSIFRDGVVVPAQNIVCMNLRDWHRPPNGKVGIDVTLGRFAFGVGAEPAHPEALRVTYSYGFSADVGGGSYIRPHLHERSAPPLNPPVRSSVSESDLPSVSAALAGWDVTANDAAVITVRDSRTYAGDLTFDKPGLSLTLQSEDRSRPLIRGTLFISADAPTNLTLDGLLIEGHIEVAENSRLAQLTLKHCTLVPGRALDEAGQPVQPTAASLIVDNRNADLSITLDHCITGPLQIPDAVDSLTVTDSIIDSPVDAARAQIMPVLVSARQRSPFAVTGSRLRLQVGETEPITVQLSTTPTTPAQARDALQAAVAAASAGNPAYSQARVLLLDSRLVIVPGLRGEVSVQAVDGDALATELRLTSEARLSYALISDALPNALASRARDFRVTMESDVPLDTGTQTRSVHVPGGANTLPAFTPDLQQALRSLAPAPFASALVGVFDNRLLVVPGESGFSPLLSADEATMRELGLAVARPAVAANLAGTLVAPPTTLDRVTVFGAVMVKTLTLASECIFTQPVTCQRRQAGCARFSSVPEGSVTPQRYHCQPDTALDGVTDAGQRAAIVNRLTPVFTSRRYGQPAYAQLALITADEIRTGSQDGAEMGVFQSLMQPQRLANLRTRLDEYLPFGLEAGVIFVT